MLGITRICGVTINDGVTSLKVADHIDRVCWSSVNRDQVPVCCNFDGDYGVRRAPRGFDTIADTHKRPEVLCQRGGDMETAKSSSGFTADGSDCSIRACRHANVAHPGKWLNIRNATPATLQ
jgi:hypothetical protein